MEKKLDLDEIVLLGRTMDEYYLMFNLNEELLKGGITLDVASGVSSFCAEANEKGFKVIASDRIYVLTPEEIEKKCNRDLEAVIAQLPEILDLYSWNYFKDQENLRTQRKRSYVTFLRDFRKAKNKRYVPTIYPSSNFDAKQFTLSLVSHLLFLYDEHLSYELHKAVINELVRITSREIRIFPLSNLKGERSLFVDRVNKDPDFQDFKIFIEKVNYEFIRGADEMMVIRVEP